MPEEIDYQALVESLMTELEDARRTIADLHFAKHRVSLLRHLSLVDISAFATKHYVLIIVAITLLSTVLRSLIEIRELRSKLKGGTHGESS